MDFLSDLWETFGVFWVHLSNGYVVVSFSWILDGWGKLKSKLLQFPSERIPVMCSNTMAWFHQDHVHFLFVHETMFSIYESKELEYVHQWVPEILVESPKEWGEVGSKKNAGKFIPSSLASHVHDFVKMIIGSEE
ncbi:hypothetical protein V6N11_034154 [Hibiscus sabdariffa]|uniref:Uncharacterized protein n=1 Tax=Hibiscus sabdariffa TaxID=183260 RepID=A0ABR2S213_9ROSI